MVVGDRYIWQREISSRETMFRISFDRFVVLHRKGKENWKEIVLCVEAFVFYVQRDSVWAIKATSVKDCFWENWLENDGVDNSWGRFSLGYGLGWGFWKPKITFTYVYCWVQAAGIVMEVVFKL